MFVEYRKEDSNVPIKEVHKMSEAQLKKEMTAHPQLEYSETIAASGIGPPGPKAGRRPPLIRTSAINASGSSGLWFHCRFHCILE